MLELFTKKVLNNKDKHNLDINGLFYKDNLKILPIASIVILGISIYWIIINIFSNSYNLTIYAEVVIIMQCLASIYMFIFSFSKKIHTPKTIRTSYWIFYFIVALGVVVLSLSRNLQIIATGQISANTGISIATYYIFLFTFMPLPNKSDSVFVIFLMFCCLLIPDTIAHTSTYSFFSCVILLICFVIAYLYIKNAKLKNVNHQNEISGLTDKLLDYSYVDPLTGILNRRAMDKYISYLKEKDNCHTIGVIIFDIDYFKSYNDYYNHVNGDKVLQIISNTAQDCISNEHSFIFRYGGEEFITIIEGADKEQLCATMLSFKKAIHNAAVMRHDTTEFDRITVTIGAAIENIPNTTDDYVVTADNQLFLGKNNNRNCCYFENQKIDN